MKQTLKKIMSIMLCCTMVVSMMTCFIPSVSAATVPPSRTILNENYAKKKSLQPLGNFLQVDELKNWSPEKDPDSRYNRSSIPLKNRYTGPLVNPNASTDAKVLALCNSTSESQGVDTVNSYAFNYYQYLDTFNFWGGTKGKGVISIPTPERIDAAHKNGVKVTGTVFFPFKDPEFVNKAMTDFVQSVYDVNTRKTVYPVADKMFEIAKYYGFDGFFINQETSISIDLANKLRNMMKYIQQNKPEGFVIQWYDSMTSGGSIVYQDSISQDNISMIQDGDTRYADEAFINFNWSVEKINTTVETMTKAGRSPFEAYASWENIPYEDYNNHPGRLDYLLGEDKKLKTSIGILGPNITLSGANSPEEFTNINEGKLWVGPTFDPTDTSTRDNKDKFPGFSSAIADKTPILGTEFVTHFTTGNGYKFYEDGIVTGKRNGWSNFSLTDIMPTWRWIVESNGSKLKPSIDYADAYWGGTSLKVEGNLESENPNHIKLYSTKLDIKDNSKLSITYKTQNTGTMKVGLCFGDSYDQTNFEFFDVSNGVSKNGWTTSEIDLSGHSNKTAIAISMKFESKSNISNYSVNVGRIAITTQQKNPGLIAKSSIDEIMFHDYKSAEARIYWYEAENADYYEIHRLKADGSREFVGATPNTAFYLAKFQREAEEDAFTFEITPVTFTGVKSKPSIIRCKWYDPIDSSESIPESKPINLALNKTVTSNVKSEPNQEPKNIVDGIITGSKWCANPAMNQNQRPSELAPHEITVDLGKETQVGRWVVYNANCPDGNEGSGFNTVNYKLKYSTDGVNFADADVVYNNKLDITDRNLETPIIARYVKISVTKDCISDNWAATRIYEFELYAEKNDYQSEPVDPINITVKNNVGTKDTARFDKLSQRTTVKLYNSMEATTPIAEKSNQSLYAGQPDNDYIAFGEFNDTKSYINLGSNEGRLYYSTISTNPYTGLTGSESVRRSVPFYGEAGPEILLDKTNSKLFCFSNEKIFEGTNSKGVMYVTNMPEGAVIKIYYGSGDSPILTSAPADNSGVIILRQIPLYTTWDKKIYYEVYASGYKSPIKKQYSYSLVSNNSNLPFDKSDLLELRSISIDQNKYLKDSLDNYNNVCAQADAIIGNDKATLDEIKTVTAALNFAISRLTESSSTNKADLQAMYDSNKDKAETNYTASTWGAFKTALENAKEVIDNADANQKDVDDTKAALETAINALVERGNKADLQAMYDSNKDKAETNYTALTWGAFKTALANAKLVLDNTDAIQKDVDDTKAALEIAINALVERGNKADLQAMYDANKDNVEDAYVSTTWGAFKTALDNAKAVINNADAIPKDVDDAKAALDNAVKALVLRGNKADLQAIYNANKENVEGAYVSTTWGAFKTALDNAKAVINNADATPKDVDDAKAALETAIKNLVKKPVIIPTEPTLTEKVIALVKDKTNGNVTVDLLKPEIISKDILKAAKEQKKTVTFDIVNSNGNLKYSWAIDGKNVNEIKDVNLELKVSEIKANANIQKAANNESGLVLSFSHSGSLPTDTQVKVYVGDQFKDGDKLHFYYFNEAKGQLEKIADEIVVKGGYAIVSINHCSDYVLTKIENKATTPTSTETQTNTASSTKTEAQATTAEPAKTETQANTTSSTNTTPKTKNAQTGDNTPIIPFVFVVLSGIVIACITKRSKKTR
ncbi:discoidin domain-containing protein [Paludicola sp. MB14-C6]|uniref:endo-beta-N-acetylglucosaminidase n=1 Tax=Paludihabitans sp. MB14-C6 TaxID=3070656 RepID=UPI0027DE5C56|nr:discoidin domain-containing protein [Paludicola sp. MB14-C6]WMJ22166.1 discoidin domain-containing protein [Paludicola sp. MB14-C6]